AMLPALLLSPLSLELGNAIHSLMREWNCGQGNMETPRILTSTGFGQVIVDIGLGEDAAESRAAVKNGYVVFSFDPVLQNVHKLRRHVGVDSMQEVSLSLVNGSWKLTPELTPPPAGRGFVYAFHAAVGSVNRHVRAPDKGNMGSIAQAQSSTLIPEVRLDSILPEWVQKIYFLKVDTQGYELRVLHGANESIRSHRFRYIMYEFSPWLMLRDNLGDPKELLEFLPKLGSLCFDMMGQHNMFPHAQEPLHLYYSELVAGNNSYMFGNQLPPSGKIPSISIGPWEDIMCWDPNSLPRDVPMNQGTAVGHKKFYEDNSFGRNFQARENARNVGSKHGPASRAPGAFHHSLSQKGRGSVARAGEKGGSPDHTDELVVPGRPHRSSTGEEEAGGSPKHAHMQRVPDGSHSREARQGSARTKGAGESGRARGHANALQVPAFQGSLAQQRRGNVTGAGEKGSSPDHTEELVVSGRLQGSSDVEGEAAGSPKRDESHNREARQGPARRKGVGGSDRAGGHANADQVLSGLHSGDVQRGHGSIRMVSKSD
ncbi:MAG: hypothetical protein SGPRY_011977, partial [Prymnesium sp.]